MTFPSAYREDDSRRRGRFHVLERKATRERAGTWRERQRFEERRTNPRNKGSKTGVLVYAQRGQMCGLRGPSPGSQRAFTLLGKRV